MKMTFCRVVAAMMSLVLCITAFGVAPSAVQAASEMPVLAFVPLDNRPVCVDRILYQAASAGFDVRLPEEEWYTTRLDGQGGNISPYGCQVGDGSKIMTWLEEMEAAGCDWYVIHLDQMFSGGLVGSRYPDQNALTSVETNIVDRLVALSNKVGNHVYFVDTVMRLASTGSFKGFEIPEYGTFRTYAAQVRKELNKSNFYTTDYNASVAQLDLIAANYQIGASGETLTYYTGERTEWKGPLTQAMVNTYHGSRRRKMDLINLMMQFGNRNVTYIIGVDDASPQFTIQGNEINFIHQRMQALGYTYFLSADTDSCGMMAIARCATDYYGDTEIPVKVRYFGDQIDVAADDYDIGTLRSNVTTHLETANCKVVDSGAEMEVLVLTKISSSYTLQSAYSAVNAGTISQSQLDGYISENTTNINNLIAQAKSNIANNIPTIIVECSTEGNYLYAWVKGLTNLQNELLTKVEISKLMGYSNWNTVGNTLGIAIGQGVARYAYLKNEANVSPVSHVGFKKAMTYSFIKDITYNARNKHQHFDWTFQYWITNKAGGSGWNNGNFYQSMINYTGSTYKEDWESCAGEHYVNNELEYAIMKGGDASAYGGCGQQVVNALMAGDFYTDFSNVATADFGTVTVDRFYCPWYRQFEISFSIYAADEYYATDDLYMTQIPLNQNFATFYNQSGLQYMATKVTVTNRKGQLISDTDLVATDYTVNMVVGGRMISYQAVVWGDVNSDANMNTSDVRACMMHVIGADELTDAQKVAGDFDGNARISSTDARQILQTALNL